MSGLGWIDAPRASRAQWPELAAFAAAVRDEGLTRVLLCGMGGSSLAPAVLAQAFGATAFDVLDSTDAGAVLDGERRARLARTIFLIASRSGTTVATFAAYRYFAASATPRQFVAVTEPWSPMAALGRWAGVRA